MIHGEPTFTYAELYARARRLASALARRGIGVGDTVAIMAPNVPAMLEAHYGVPMAGAVLNALNYRLDARTIAFILQHADAKLLITDAEFSDTVGPALDLLPRPIPVVDVVDPLADAGRGGARLGAIEYEALLAEGDPEHEWARPADEWQALALLYTSGTTGNPKGVVYSHRGAYLNALGNALAFGLTPRSVYLWTLPMFHCNGWTYPWAVTAVGGTHVCLRKVDPALIFRLIRRHGVTHLCGAPGGAHRADPRAGGSEDPTRPRGRGRDRRGGPAVGRHRRDGVDGLPRDAPLRADRVLRPGDALRLAARVGRAARCRSAPPTRRGRAWRTRRSTGSWSRTRWRSRRCAAGRGHARRGDAAGQHRDEGVPPESRRPPRRRSAAAGSTPGTWRSGTRTATSRSRTGRRTSSSRAGRTSRRSRSRRSSTGTPPSWRPPSWRSPTRSGARRPARSSRSGRRRRPITSRGRHRMVPRAPRALQGPARRRVRAAPEDLDREDPEIRPARAGEGGGLR